MRFETGLFESLAADDSDSRIAARQSLAVANSRVNDRYGAFLDAANSPSERTARLSVVRSEISDVVSSVCEEYGGDPKKIETSILKGLTAAKYPLTHDDEEKSIQDAYYGTPNGQDLLDYPPEPKERPKKRREGALATSWPEGEAPPHGDTFGHEDAGYTEYPHEQCPNCGTQGAGWGNGDGKVICNGCGYDWQEGQAQPLGVLPHQPGHPGYQGPAWNNPHSAKSGADHWRELPGESPESDGQTSINLEPNWEGMRAWIKNVHQTDPENAHNVNQSMGTEAVPELVHERPEAYDPRVVDYFSQPEDGPYSEHPAPGGFKNDPDFGHGASWKRTAGLIRQALTAKDFKLVADLIATAPIQDQEREALAQHAAGYLTDTNPNFDVARFIQAAMGSPATGRDQFQHPQPDVDVSAGEPQHALVDDPTWDHGASTRTARRPKMCPYHREVTDIALASGDPVAGFNAMSGHAWGPQHCQGEFQGSCNFKREMVTQKYWDDKAEQAQQRREERELQLQQQPDLTDLTEPEAFDEPEGLDAELAEAPSAIGEGVHENFNSEMGALEPMAASTKTAAPPSLFPPSTIPAPTTVPSSQTATGPATATPTGPAQVGPPGATAPIGPNMFQNVPSAEQSLFPNFHPNQMSQGGGGSPSQGGGTTFTPASGGPGKWGEPYQPAQEAGGQATGASPDKLSPQQVQQQNQYNLRQHEQQMPGWDPTHQELQHAQNFYHGQPVPGRQGAHQADVVMPPAPPEAVPPAPANPTPVSAPPPPAAAPGVAAMGNPAPVMPDAQSQPEGTALGNPLLDQLRQRVQMPQVPQAPAMAPVAATQHQAEAPRDGGGAVKTEDLPAANADGLSKEPSGPAINKDKWKPNALNPNGNLEPIDTDMSGSPHPTEQIDVLEAIPDQRDGDFLDGTRTVTETQDLPSADDTGQSTDKNVTDSGPTKTWSENNGASPVTHETQSSTNPIKALAEETFLPRHAVEAAIRDFETE